MRLRLSSKGKQCIVETRRNFYLSFAKTLLALFKGWHTWSGDSQLGGYPFHPVNALVGAYARDRFILNADLTA